MTVDGGMKERETKGGKQVYSNSKREMKRMWDQIRIVCLVQDRLDMLIN